MSTAVRPSGEEADPDGRYRRGSAGYRRIAVAMFACGVATFALLHNAQAILPSLSDAFGTSPAGASLAVSVSTGALAVGVIPVSALSERFGRARVMTVAIAAAATLGLLAPLCRTYPLLLSVRGLQGLALAGLPAVAVAYLSEEIHPEALAGSVGVLIGGNGIGGLSGRLLAGAVADVAGWRAGMAAVGVLTLVCGAAFVVLLPRQRHFRIAGADGGVDGGGVDGGGCDGGRVDAAAVTAGVRRHVTDTRMLRLYLVGLVLMGSFSTLYNYTGYRLLRSPFSLPPAVVGLVFVAYLAGTASSAVAGRLAERAGPRVVLLAGLALAMAAAALTLPDRLPAVLAGLVLQTVGFFGAHSVASGWVGRRATVARAQASALYTLAYYLGASACGWAGGLAYGRVGWSGVVVFMIGLLALALVAAASLRPVDRVPFDRDRPGDRGPDGADGA